MSGKFTLLLWFLLLLAGVGVMQWGAGRASSVVDTLRERFGVRGLAGGALVGLATGSPEISVNVTSVVFGWPDLGLGAALGSNVPMLPILFVLSYLATRLGSGALIPASPMTAGTDAGAGPEPRVVPEAVEVQVLPYLLVVLLLAALTLPPPWAGLQWYDGVILVAAWAAYLVHALALPKAQVGAAAAQRAGRFGPALLGVPMIAGGALAAVYAANHINKGLGISDLVGGLFIVGLLCALPESVAVWKLAREGRTTSALASTVGDGIVSLTLALVPVAIVAGAVGNTAIYAINLAFLVFALTTYMALNHWRRGQEIGPGRVFLYVGAYGIYLAATVWVLMR